MQDTSLRPSTDRARLRLWGWPIALGILSATGLVSALVSDTWGDWWSWIALGLPTAAMAWYGLRRGPSSSSLPDRQR